MSRYQYTLKTAIDYLQEKIREKYPYLTDKQIKNVLTESLLRNIVKNEVLDMVNFILQEEFELIKQ